MKNFTRKHIVFLALAAVFGFHAFLMALYQVPSHYWRGLRYLVYYNAVPWAGGTFKLFAPNPLHHSYSLWVKVTTTNGVEHQWRDLGTQYQIESYSNRLSGIYKRNKVFWCLSKDLVHEAQRGTETNLLSEPTADEVYLVPPENNLNFEESKIFKSLNNYFVNSTLREFDLDTVQSFEFATALYFIPKFEARHAPYEPKKRVIIYPKLEVQRAVAE